jgi:putative transposase
MQQIITAKLKLKTKLGEHRLLRQTQLAYRDALNYVSEWSFTNNKVSSETKLHQGTYRSVRQSFGLPSQLACSVIRQVSANYKGLWTKVLKNINHRKAGYTKKRFKGLDKPPKYASPTVTYVYGYDYGFKTRQLVSIMTLRGRIILPYHGYAKHIALIQNGATCGEARLWYDRKLSASLQAGCMGTGPEDCASVSKPRSRNVKKPPKKTGREPAEGTEVTYGTGHAHDETAP